MEEGKGRTRSKPKGNCHTSSGHLRFVFHLVYSSACPQVATANSHQHICLFCGQWLRPDLLYSAGFCQSVSPLQVDCRHDSRVEAASTKLTESEIKEAQAPQQVLSTRKVVCYVSMQSMTTTWWQLRHTLMQQIRSNQRLYAAT